MQGRFQCQMKPQQRRSYAKRPEFITLKDHKENFKSNQKCCLINASKSEMGIVSKKYLENISKLISKFQYNQWGSTSTVIEWFKAIKNKVKCWFIKFDIAEFYSLIAMELLDRSISFAKSLIDIEGNIINTINHARKSLLFDDNCARVKKDGNPLFIVTMGSFDSAEVCELVRLYLLNKIKPLLGSSNVGFVSNKQHWNLRNHPRIQDEIEIGRWPGSIHPSA